MGCARRSVQVLTQANNTPEATTTPHFAFLESHLRTDVHRTSPAICSLREFIPFGKQSLPGCRGPQLSRCEDP
ncbi:hypothetical protein J6590_059965 [Homalodisca vitripennis]|nr:hypothetical protein J6590_059965 [Homalodisca vitripennis]